MRSKKRRFRKQRKTRQRGGGIVDDIMNMFAVTKDEDKITKSLTDLDNKFKASENKYPAETPEGKKIAEIRKLLQGQQTDFETIKTKIEDLEHMLKTPQKTPGTVTKTKTNDVLAALSTPPEAQPQASAAQSRASAAQSRASAQEAQPQTPAAQPQARAAQPQTPAQAPAAPAAPAAGGKKRKTKKRKHKKGKRKYPKSKKHYNQKGGVACSPVMVKAEVKPFQGPPWTGKVSSWPGVGGVQGETNYYAVNGYNSQPDRFPDQISGF